MNYLDDNSEKVYLVFNEHSEVAVDDFLVANHINKSWQDIEYTVVDNLIEMNKQLSNTVLKNNEIRARKHELAQRHAGPLTAREIADIL